LWGNYEDQEYQYQKRFSPENFKIKKYHLNKENKTETYFMKKKKQLNKDIIFVNNILFVNYDY